jgi:hypothetical protein
VGSIRGLADTGARIERKDWTLLAIALSRLGLAPLQLQKALHLLRETYPRHVGGSFYEFRSMSSGNFSPDVYPDAQALAGDGLITIDISGQEGWQHYQATAAGVARARQLERSLRPGVVDYLRRVVEWASMRSFDQLVRRPFDSTAPGSVGAQEPRPLPPR